MAFSANKKTIVVDNLHDGFDMYQLEHPSAPIKSFRAQSRRLYVKQAVFGEGSKLIIGKSDNGEVIVYDAATGERVQTLAHGGFGTLVQCVEAFNVRGHQYIVSGGANEIKLWERRATKDLKQLPVIQRDRKMVVALILAVVSCILCRWIVTYITCNGNLAALTVGNLCALEFALTTDERG